MGVNIKVIKKEEIEPAQWDGGKTFEYFIYPENTTYLQRNFDFRISSATIERIPSAFTKFEGYSRYLVMLSNDLAIERNGKNELYKQEELFQFDSSDDIQSFSLGNDFNLMIKKGRKDIAVEIKMVDFICDMAFSFFFALKDTRLLINGKLFLLEQYTCVVITNSNHHTLAIQSNQVLLLGCWS